MKKYIALVTCLIASSAFGQVVTYQVRGKVSTLLNAPDFMAGGSYTLNFSLNQSVMRAPDLGSAIIYGLVASSLTFNYEHGTYVGTMDAATVWAYNEPIDNGGDYFSVGTPFAGNNFPPVQGNPILGTIPDTSSYGFSMLSLYDKSGTALSSKAPIDLSKISQFTDKDDQLTLLWGTTDPDRQWSVVGASVDSIEKVGPTLSPVPEPSTYGLMGSAVLFGLVARRIKRERQAQAA